VSSEVVRAGPRNRHQVALTFDACSTHAPGRYDRRITEVLAESRVPATIFLGGKWMEDNVDHVRELAQISHLELGNHTFLHPHMTEVSDERARRELEWTQAVLFTLTGRQAHLFRPPFGEVDARIAKIAAALGLRTIEYDLASGDPDVHFTREVLTKYVTESARPGSIVVMHINTRGWHTAEALPDIVSGLRARGLELVTVGELTGIEPTSGMPTDGSLP
jgi:peptidoglycan/xylan/chitin deacetylase (PgdA/CDA1 family)